MSVSKKRGGGVQGLVRRLVRDVFDQWNGAARERNLSTGNGSRLSN